MRKPVTAVSNTTSLALMINRKKCKICGKSINCGPPVFTPFKEGSTEERDYSRTMHLRCAVKAGIADQAILDEWEIEDQKRLQAFAELDRRVPNGPKRKIYPMKTEDYKHKCCVCIGCPGHGGEGTPLAPYKKVCFEHQMKVLDPDES